MDTFFPNIKQKSIIFFCSRGSLEAQISERVSERRQPPQDLRLGRKSQKKKLDGIQRAIKVNQNLSTMK